MTTQVNQATDQLSAVRGSWPMLKALVGGTDAMRKAAEAFLPQWPNEDEEGYKARLTSAVLHPAFSHTCKVMAAKPFSRPMKFKVAKAVEEYFKDIDLKGTPFAPFVASLFLECLQSGLTGILADHPPATDIKTKEQEKAAGVRPYLTVYPAESILGWKIGKQGLEMLRLMESVEEPDGEWGVKTIKQVRVLRPGLWETWRAVDGKPDEWAVHQSGTTTLKQIPFVFFYGMKLAYGVGECPLLDLAYQNVEHWQSASDQQTILHVMRVPILFGKGFPDKASITIGASHAVMATRADADLSYVEHTGAAVESGRQSLLDLEDRMRSTGADLISQKTSGTGGVTATQINSETTSGKSLLQTIVEVFEESLETCLNLMAEYTGAETAAEIELYKDFSAVSDGDPLALASAQEAGAISKQTMFEELQRRDVVSPERTWEEELTKLKGELPLVPPSEKDKSGKPTAA